SRMYSLVVVSVFITTRRTSRPTWDNSFRILGQITDCLTVFAAWVHACFLPFLQEFVPLTGAVQIGETRHLPSDVSNALIQLWVFEIPGVVKFLPGLRNGGLLRNHPGMKRAPDFAQTHRTKRAHRAARDPDQAEHLSFKFLEPHKVERVLQNAAVATMILGCAENDSLRLLHFFPQAEYVFRILRLVVLAVTEQQLIIAQIDKLGLAP